MKHRWAVPFLVAAALSAAAATAQAQPGPMPGPEPGMGFEPGPGMPPQGRPGAGMAQDLGLTEAQQEKLREIMEEQRAQREAVYEKLAANREALHGLLEGGSADANAVGELVLEGRKLHEQSRTLRDAEQKAIRAILTPEQQKKFDQALAQRRERGPNRGPGDFQGQPPGGPGARQPRPPVGTGTPGQRPMPPQYPLQP